MRCTAERIPSAWSQQLNEAVNLKRRGQFLAAAAIYGTLTIKSGVFYTAIMEAFYKTAAASGALLSGNQLLALARRTFEADPKAVAMAAGGPTNFEDHQSRLLAATMSEAELELYLRDICGNTNYRLPRPYDAAVAEYHQGNDEPVKRLMAAFNAGHLDAKTEYPTRSPAKQAPVAAKAGQGGGGCYIATAVYGSYDAPQVRVLRRFRDQTLATSQTGRAFIRFYYATSPPIAARLQNETAVNNFIRRLLDLLVRRLDRRA